MKDLLTVTDLGREIGVAIYRIDYAANNGLIPRPMRLGPIRVWTAEEAKMVREYFLSPRGPGRPRQHLPPVIHEAQP